MLRWYLIHTKPLGEGLAQTNLERQEYQVYLPRAMQPVRYNGHWRDRIVSLFPRYLFLRLNEGRQSLAPARSTLGVASVVRFGLQPRRRKFLVSGSDPLAPEFPGQDSREGAVFERSLRESFEQLDHAAVFGVVLPIVEAVGRSDFLPRLVEADDACPKTGRVGDRSRP